MTRTKMIEKYREPMKVMNEINHTSDDCDVLLDKMIYMNNKYHKREVTGDDVYLMPEEFPYAEFDADYQELIKPEV